VLREAHRQIRRPDRLAPECLRLMPSPKFQAPAHVRASQSSFSVRRLRRRFATFAAVAKLRSAHWQESRSLAVFSLKIAIFKHGSVKMLWERRLSVVSSVQPHRLSLSRATGERSRIGCGTFGGSAPNIALHLTALKACALRVPSAAYGCSGGR
jgi:hypothetical protein